ncbi:MAG: transcription elongation factor GreA [Bdellovibrionales bacterium]|nr:transcription elongation factor GreA [Bdellovibrionales bacterium]
MSDSLPITLKGKQSLEAELKRLMHEERPNTVKAIEHARSNGDLSENADYDAAKERQGWIEARIAEINHQLSGAQVVDTAKLTGDRVVFGAHVELIDLNTDKSVTYQIVGISEADVAAGKISIVSPLARALIGKKVGEEVVVNTPSGDKEYEVKKLFFQ